MKLLVVDFDYFFPNPTMQDPASWTQDTQLGLWDWGHKESELMVSAGMWAIRAASFDRHNVPRPTVRSLESFWDRFVLPDAQLLVSDSNLWAGTVDPVMYQLSPEQENWSEVWLFDAHHDCGYHEGALEKYQDDQLVNCENWMLVHQQNGAGLHVRYPLWRGTHEALLQARPPSGDQYYDCEPRPVVEVDRRLDIGLETFPEFDGVFLCRSGAWVPAWCDEQFEELIAAYPGEHLWVDTELPRNREWSEELVAETSKVFGLTTRQSPDTAS